MLRTLIAALYLISIPGSSARKMKVFGLEPHGDGEDG
jgi:hypothetical protein